MKRFAPLLLAALAACKMRPTINEDNPDEPRPIAKVGQQTNSQQTQRLKEQGVADAPVTEASGSATAPLAVDPSKKLEYADVTVELGDPQGMRALVPYLMKPEVWMLIKCEQDSTTTKHYRFQKVSTGEGRPIPEVDIFKTRR